MKGFLVFDHKDEDGNTLAVNLDNPRQLYKVRPQPVIDWDEPLEPDTPAPENDGCFKAIILLLAVGAAAVMGLMPRSAYACGLLELDCILGFSNRTQIRAERDVEQARIEAAAQAEIARIQGEADARMKQAEAEVERVKQQRYQSEADRDIAIAQAQAQAEQYKAMIAGLTTEKVAGIQSNADTQIATLQESAKIAIEGIVQTGQTERWRIGGAWLAVIVLTLVLVIGWRAWLQRPQAPVVLLPNEPTAKRLPWADAYESLEIVEVKNGQIIRRH